MNWVVRLIDGLHVGPSTPDRFAAAIEPLLHSVTLDPPSLAHERALCVGRVWILWLGTARRNEQYHDAYHCA